MTRGARFVLALLLAASAVSVLSLVLLSMLIGRGPQVSGGSTLVLHPHGSLPEVLPGLVVGGGDELTVRGYVELVRKAQHDPRISGILLKPGPLESPFWAKIQELRDALQEFRAAGKPVHAFLEYGGDREYYLATAADRIYLLPSATLDLTGVATYEVFLRGTFDLIGTYPDFLHIGDYKTAVNTYLEKGFTPAHKEMSESLNTDQYEQLVRGIAASRRRSEDDVRALLDAGPFQPEEALQAGLIDEVAYEDELDDLVPSLAESPEITAEDYAMVSWSSAGVTRRSAVAVINVSGVIASGASGYDPLNGAVAGSDTIVEAIRDARANASVRAIVVRIDSPGGSSTASDVIWRELDITRGHGRPVIVSMSDLAASGGYYVALGGDQIVAEPGTLTGSIGVYTGKFVTAGTLDKLGANVESTSRGEHAEMYSSDRRFTPDERAKVESSMQAVYDQFIERAAASRQMAPEQVDEIAQGRVWTGRQARGNGLVDELGGLYTAIGLAKARARIPAGDEVDLIVYPPRKSLFDVLSEEFRAPADRMRAEGAAEALVALLGPRERHALAALLAPARLFRSGQVLAHMPYVFVR